MSLWPLVARRFRALSAQAPWQRTRCPPVCRRFLKSGARLSSTHAQGLTNAAHTHSPLRPQTRSIVLMACLEPTLDDPFGFGNGVTAESCPWWVRSMRVNDEAIIPMTISTNPGIQNYGAARLVGRRRVRTPYRGAALSLRASAAAEEARSPSDVTDSVAAAKNLARRLEARALLCPRDASRAGQPSRARSRRCAKGSFQPRGLNH